MFLLQNFFEIRVFFLKVGLCICHFAGFLGGGREVLLFDLDGDSLIIANFVSVLLFFFRLNRLK